MDKTYIKDIFQSIISWVIRIIEGPADIILYDYSVEKGDTSLNMIDSKELIQILRDKRELIHEPLYIEK